MVKYVNSKKKLCDYACYDFATKLDDYSTEKALELINLGFAWCYAMFATKNLIIIKLMK